MTDDKWIPWNDLTPEQQREILNAPCEMQHQPPMDFAYCETHDETFPLGAVCSRHKAALERQAIAAHARGLFADERAALDALALDERARSR